MLTNPVRIVFFGTTNFATCHLYALTYYKNCKIIAIFTQTTKTKSLFSLENIAKKYNILLFQSSKISYADIINFITNNNVDLIIVVSYGLIFSKEILSLPKLGCINVHGSVLPRWRGPAPIQRALENGDNITGISIIKMDVGIDTGNILCTKNCRILPNDTYFTLSHRLAHIGAVELSKILQQLISKKITIIGISQTLTKTKYARKILKKEAQIDWNLSAIQLERCIRAFNPWPVSYFFIKKHYRVKVWESKINQNIEIIKKNCTKSIVMMKPGTILIADTSGIYVLTGDGILILTKLQIEGKKILPTREILNSRKNWFAPYSILE